MTCIKKSLIALSILCVMFMTSLSSNVKVNALENNYNNVSTRALETYTKSVKVGLGVAGYTEVTLKITHNMTTGKSYISSISHSDYINVGYVTAKVKSVSTDPAKGKYFTGRISIKVSVSYTNASKNLVSVEYVNS